MNTQILTDSPASRISDIVLYRWILSYLAPYKRHILAFFICGTAVTLTEIAIPKGIQLLIDHVIPQQNGIYFFILLVSLALLVVLMFVAQALGNLIKVRSFEKGSHDMQFSLFSQYRLLGIPYAEQQSTGKTLSLFQTEATAVQRIYREFFPDIVQALIVLTATAAFMIHISALLSLLAVPGFLIYLLIGSKLDVKAKHYGKVARNHKNESQQMIYDCLGAMKELRAYGTVNWSLTLTTTKHRQFTEAFIRHFYFVFWKSSLRQITAHLGSLLVFWIGASLVINHQLTIGNFVAFTFLFFIFVSHLIRTVNVLADQQFVIVQSEPLYRFMHFEPGREKESPETVPYGEVQGEWLLKDIHFAYPQKLELLKGIDLYIRSGENVAIVGESGCGKSTLLKLLGRFYDPVAGHILLDGTPIRQWPIPQLREHVGYVFQDNYLFAGTIKDNLLFGRENATKEEMLLAAKLADAHDFIEALPEGYDTDIGERGAKLSGGQKQRLALSRLFLRNPTVVLLDEATSALDAVSEAKVYQAIHGVFHNRTVVSVTHRLDLLHHYDRVLVMEHGQLLKQAAMKSSWKLKGVFIKCS